VLSAVLLALVPIAYGVVLILAGYPAQVGPFAVGALGWLIAFALRTPVIVVGIRLCADGDSAQRVQSGRRRNQSNEADLRR
jgi:hypothetical protein